MRDDAGAPLTALSLKQSKTGVRVCIPCTAALRIMLDALPRGDAMTLLVNPQGRPWTSNAFQTAWAKATDGDAFHVLHWHDLRGTAITMLVGGGLFGAALRRDHGA